MQLGRYPVVANVLPRCEISIIAAFFKPRESTLERVVNRPPSDHPTSVGAKLIQDLVHIAPNEHYDALGMPLSQKESGIRGFNDASTT